MSKVTKRQRKDLETSWKKERTELQKQLQQSQQLIKDLQKQISNRDAPSHVTEKINILITENELLLNKIKELEVVLDDVQSLKTEMQRLRDKNSSDWNYWRKQQSDLYAQLRQHNHIKESILCKFDRLQKQVSNRSQHSSSLGHVNSSISIRMIEIRLNPSSFFSSYWQIKLAGDSDNRLLRDISVGPISLNSFQNEANTKTSLSNFSRETLGDDIELPHGTIDGRAASATDIAGTIDDSFTLPSSVNDTDKQRMFEKTYSAQENTAANIEEVWLWHALIGSWNVVLDCR